MADPGEGAVDAGVVLTGKAGTVTAKPKTVFNMADDETKHISSLAGEELIKAMEEWADRREHLAEDRTKLAQFRTRLAEERTALANGAPS